LRSKLAVAQRNAIAEHTYLPVSLQLRNKRMSMLHDAIRGRRPPFQRGDVCIVTPGQDAGAWEVVWQEIRISQPADLALVGRPCLKSVPVETMNGDDTVIKN